MLEELEVVKLVVARLEKIGISYMLTGSLATNYYSIPRMTRDIDVVIELSISDVGKLYNAFKEDFYIDGDVIKDAVSHEGMFNIIHNESVIKIDFIIRKNSEYRKLEFDRRKRIDIEETKIWIATAEDIVLSKLFWSKDSHSEMQLRDVRNMLSCVQELDKRYIEKWVERLDLQQVYSEVVNG